MKAGKRMEIRSLNIIWLTLVVILAAMLDFYIPPRVATKLRAKASGPGFMNCWKNNLT